MYPIPANATRIRYLESTGTQYVDTGVAAAAPSALKAEIDCFGNICFGFTHQRAGSGTWLGISNSAAWSKDYYSRYNIGASRRRQVFTWDGATGFYVDGALRRGFSASIGTDIVAGISWPLFFVYDFNAGGYEAGTPIGGRAYSARLWLSDSLVRSFVPVRIGQTGYLFDRVSGQLFGNAGTGDFVLGPDTFAQGVVPTRMMPMGVRKPTLPYEADGLAASTPLVAGPDRNGG